MYNTLKYNSSICQVQGSRKLGNKGEEKLGKSGSKKVHLATYMTTPFT